MIGHDLLINFLLGTDCPRPPPQGSAYSWPIPVNLDFLAAIQRSPGVFRPQEVASLSTIIWPSIASPPCKRPRRGWGGVRRTLGQGHAVPRHVNLVRHRPRGRVDVHRRAQRQHQALRGWLHLDTPRWSGWAEGGVCHPSLWSLPLGRDQSCSGLDFRNEIGLYWIDCKEMIATSILSFPRHGPGK